MTLQEAKDQIAVGYGVKDWEDLQHDMYVDDRVIELLEIYDIAVDRYAEAKAKEAFEAARGIDYNGTNEYDFADYEEYKNS